MIILAIAVSVFSTLLIGYLVYMIIRSWRDFKKWEILSNKIGEIRKSGYTLGWVKKQK